MVLYSDYLCNFFWIRCMMWVSCWLSLGHIDLTMFGHLLKLIPCMLVYVPSNLSSSTLLYNKISANIFHILGSFSKINCKTRIVVVSLLCFLCCLYLPNCYHGLCWLLPLWLHVLASMLLSILWLVHSRFHRGFDCLLYFLRHMTAKG